MEMPPDKSRLLTLLPIPDPEDSIMSLIEHRSPRTHWVLIIYFIPIIGIRYRLVYFWIIWMLFEYLIKIQTNKDFSYCSSWVDERVGIHFYSLLQILHTDLLPEIHYFRSGPTIFICFLRNTWLTVGTMVVEILWKLISLSLNTLNRNTFPYF